MINTDRKEEAMEIINSRAWRIIENMTDNAPDDIHDALVQIATEQDRIARQDERERCVKAAVKAHCKMCNFCFMCKYADGKGEVFCDERESQRPNGMGTEDE